MKKLFILTAAVLVGMASCSKENGSTIKPEGAEGIGNLAFYLNTNATTRATNGTEAESKVNEVEIYIFEDDGETLESISGGYVVVATPDFGDFTDDESEFAPGLDGKYVTTVPVGATGGVDQPESYQILVVANAKLGEPEEGATIMDLQATVAAGAAYQFSVTNTKTIPTGGFIMAGINAAATVVAEQSNAIEVDLYRNVSKITKPSEKTGGATVDLDDYAQEDLDLVFGEGKVEAGDTEAIEFAITGYAVVNGMIKSHVGFNGTGDLEDGTFDPGYTGPDTYTNEWDNWDAGEFVGLDWKSQLSDDEGDENGETELALGRISSNSAVLKENNTPVTSIASWTGVYSGNGAMIPTDGNEPNIYLYESKPGLLQESTGTYQGYNADQVIAIIIEGTLKAGTTTVTRYWRVNIREEEAYHIIRNSEYQTVVNKIATIGWATPWEAEEEKPIIDKPGDTTTDFVINVIPWDVKIVGPDQM